MSRAFAEHGSDAFNLWMESEVAALSKEVGEALGSDLVALVLGGGYARGEGGVLYTPLGERPYNDLDFTLVLARRHDPGLSSLSSISQKYGKRLGIDVDFSRPLTIADISAWPHWLMWTDLLAGHRVLLGDPEVLRRHAPSVLRQSPPLIEATRLMLNRGAGLLWSLRIRRGLDAPHDSDFVRRNVMKCILAMGDAVIIANGAHQTPYSGRELVLESLLERDRDAAGLDLAGAYREALLFRLLPGEPQPEAFVEEALLDWADRWGRAWLYLESRRTRRQFPTVQSYIAYRGVREESQNTPAKLPRNLVQNLRRGRFSVRYPREELYRALPELLCVKRSDNEEWKHRSSAFLSTWRRFN